MITEASIDGLLASAGRTLGRLHRNGRLHRLVSSGKLDSLTHPNDAMSESILIGIGATDAQMLPVQVLSSSLYRPT
jgi:hypothetical protein